MPISKNQRGLTLIEVLVALAVLSLVAGSLLILMGQQVRQATIIEERMLARIVAENALSSYIAARQIGADTDPQGEEDIDGRVFSFRIRRQDAPIEEYETVVVEVRLSRDGQVIASLETLQRAPGP
ncbi:MAG: type II secretion system minor pseudopilin GspI [Pseudomonadota bacterium]